MFRSILALLLSFLTDSPERLKSVILWLLDQAKAYAASTTTEIDDAIVSQVRAFVLSADFDRLCQWLRDKFGVKADADVGDIDRDAILEDAAYELRVAGWESLIPVILPIIQALIEAWRKRRQNPTPPVNV